jgi:60 kDa SS-A/Ro ribonucleoprotein
MGYLGQYADKKKVPQRSRLSEDQVKNAAGGYVYKVDRMEQLKRFLILGTCGGTYYASERKITTANMENVRTLLKKSGVEAVEMASEISLSGRAPKNDEAILVLAMASVHDNVAVRKAAFEALPKICRIGTHLYKFLEFRKLLEGGWGRKMREAVAGWFNARNADNLALQVAKYKSREGWSARDALRLSHPKAPSAEHGAVYKWVVSEGKELADGAPALLEACNRIASITGSGKRDISKALRLIGEYRLPREVIPTQLLGSGEIWEAMLPHMGATALLRNLGKMTSIGLLKPNGNVTVDVAQKLEDPEFIRRGRVHPLNVLVGKMVYDSGHGMRGKLSWNRVNAISAALEDAFYNAFGAIEPTGKKTLVAIDVSGSMGGGWYSQRGNVMGVPGLSPAIVATVMAMATVRSEKSNCHVVGFDHQLRDLNITRKDSLEEAVRKGGFRGGATDASLPMIWALEQGIDVEMLAIYTDNETWSGKSHPSAVLKQYRKKKGIQTRFAAVGITATNCTIADSKDPLSVNVVGFDSATPQIVSAFARGEV